MKHLASLLALSLLAPCGYAAQLNNYQEVEAALLQGKHLTFVIDFDQCKYEGTNTSVRINQQASYSPDNVLISKDGYIKTRGMTYSSDIAALPTLKGVNQAYAYIFDKHNQLHIANAFLDPVSFKEVAPTVKVTCELGSNFKIFA